MALKNQNINPNCPFCGHRLVRGRMSDWKCKGCNRFVDKVDFVKQRGETVEEWMRRGKL